MPHLPPHFVYRLGLVAQVLTDAAPHGLTLGGLADRTKLAREMLEPVLRVSLERRHARRDGGRYYAEPLSGSSLQP